MEVQSIEAKGAPPEGKVLDLSTTHFLPQLLRHDGIHQRQVGLIRRQNY
jgi:hypothetical protein